MMPQQTGEETTTCHGFLRASWPVAAGVLGAACRRSAQDWPSRPVRIVFPLAAGGGGDVFTRALADELQKAWHQPVVVENRPGGGQNIGARACAEAAPDGYTICVMSSEPAVYNQFLYKTIPYDPEKDLAADRQPVLQHARGGHQQRDQGQDVRRDDRDGEGTARQAQLRAPSRSRPRISWTS